MKKCPFCKAEIDDDSRFCLFCMTSLESKNEIKSVINSDKKWPLFLIAAFLIIVIITVCFFALKSRQNDNDSAFHSSLPVNSPVHDGDSSSGQSSNSSNSISSTPSNISQGGNSYNSEDNPHKPDKNNSGGNNSGNNSSSNSISSTNPSSSDNNSSNDKTDNSSSNLSSSDSSYQDAPTVSSGYIYRAAKTGDDYSSYATIPENAIVITKVTAPSSNGVYNIPSTIDGKPVIAIMDNAFGASNIKDTVKTVIIPASIKTIWAYGFFYCNNLTDIYIKGEALYIGGSPFPPVSRRTGTLTIHCSATCHNRNFTKWKYLAEYNGAVYEEWNG